MLSCVLAQHVQPDGTGHRSKLLTQYSLLSLLFATCQGLTLCLVAAE